MKIQFITEIHEDSYYTSRECHSIEVNGKIIMSQTEGIEPENVSFGRDLCSPHEVEPLIKMIINAVKNGEEIKLEHITMEEFV